ncbi:MAG: OmpA family protein, partial [Calditrichia bacterium]
YMLLTQLMRALREFPDRQIVVAGHTDSQGNEAYNQLLSERRADAVREYLQTHMILPDQQYTSVGYGENQPVASNDTAEGRRQNRRVEIVINLEPAGE